VKPSGRTETRQWTVDPQDGQPRGFAFLWRRFEIPDLPAPMLACVMATVPANELIRRAIKSQEDDPRMPAILEDDAWSTWLGEDGATPAAAKALLKTMEGVNWQAAPEPKKPRSRKP
jgi:putative SOS response-associated peptidase YedK